MAIQGPNGNNRGKMGSNPCASGDVSPGCPSQPHTQNREKDQFFKVPPQLGERPRASGHKGNPVLLAKTTGGVTTDSDENPPPTLSPKDWKVLNEKAYAQILPELKTPYNEQVTYVPQPDTVLLDNKKDVETFLKGPNGTISPKIHGKHLIDFLEEHRWQITGSAVQNISDSFRYFMKRMESGAKTALQKITIKYVVGHKVIRWAGRFLLLEGQKIGNTSIDLDDESKNLLQEMIREGLEKGFESEYLRYKAMATEMLKADPHGTSTKAELLIAQMMLIDEQPDYEIAKGLVPTSSEDFDSSVKIPLNSWFKAPEAVASVAPAPASPEPATPKPALSLPPTPIAPAAPTQVYVAPPPPAPTAPAPEWPAMFVFGKNGNAELSIKKDLSVADKPDIRKIVFHTAVADRKTAEIVFETKRDPKKNTWSPFKITIDKKPFSRTLPAGKDLLVFADGKSLQIISKKEFDDDLITLLHSSEPNKEVAQKFKGMGSAVAEALVRQFRQLKDEEKIKADFAKAILQILPPKNRYAKEIADYQPKITPLEAPPIPLESIVVDLDVLRGKNFDMDAMFALQMRISLFDMDQLNKFVAQIEKEPDLTKAIDALKIGFQDVHPEFAKSALQKLLQTKNIKPALAEAATKILKEKEAATTKAEAALAAMVGKEEQEKAKAKAEKDRTVAATPAPAAPSAPVSGVATPPPAPSVSAAATPAPTVPVEAKILKEKEAAGDKAKAKAAAKAILEEAEVATVQRGPAIAATPAAPSAPVGGIATPPPPAAPAPAAPSPPAAQAKVEGESVSPPPPPAAEKRDAAAVLDDLQRFATRGSADGGSQATPLEELPPLVALPTTPKAAPLPAPAEEPAAEELIPYGTAEGLVENLLGVDTGKKRNAIKQLDTPVGIEAQKRLGSIIQTTKTGNEAAFLKRSLLAVDPKIQNNILINILTDHSLTEEFRTVASKLLVERKHNKEVIHALSLVYADIAKNAFTRELAAKTVYGIAEKKGPEAKEAKKIMDQYAKEHAAETRRQAQAKVAEARAKVEEAKAKKKAGALATKQAEEATKRIKEEAAKAKAEAQKQAKAEAKRIKEEEAKAKVEREKAKKQAALDAKRIAAEAKKAVAAAAAAAKKKALAEPTPPPALPPVEAPVDEPKKELEFPEVWIMVSHDDTAITNHRLKTTDPVQTKDKITRTYTYDGNQKHVKVILEAELDGDAPGLWSYKIEGSKKGYRPLGKNRGLVLYYDQNKHLTVKPFIERDREIALLETGILKPTVALPTPPVIQRVDLAGNTATLGLCKTMEISADQFAQGVKYVCPHEDSFTLASHLNITTVQEGETVAFEAPVWERLGVVASQTPATNNPADTFFRFTLGAEQRYLVNNNKKSLIKELTKNHFPKPPKEITRLVKNSLPSEAVEFLSHAIAITTDDIDTIDNKQTITKTLTQENHAPLKIRFERGLEISDAIIKVTPWEMSINGSALQTLNTEHPNVAIMDDDSLGIFSYETLEDLKSTVAKGLNKEDPYRQPIAQVGIKLGTALMIGEASTPISLAGFTFVDSEDRANTVKRGRRTPPTLTSSDYPVSSVGLEGKIYLPNSFLHGVSLFAEGQLGFGKLSAHHILTGIDFSLNDYLAEKKDWNLVARFGVYQYSYDSLYGSSHNWKAPAIAGCVEYSPLHLQGCLTRNAFSTAQERETGEETHDFASYGFSIGATLDFKNEAPPLIPISIRKIAP